MAPSASRLLACSARVLCYPTESYEHIGYYAPGRTTAIPGAEQRQNAASRAKRWEPGSPDLCYCTIPNSATDPPHQVRERLVEPPGPHPTFTPGRHREVLLVPLREPGTCRLCGYHEPVRDVRRREIGRLRLRGPSPNKAEEKLLFGNGSALPRAASSYPGLCAADERVPLAGLPLWPSSDHGDGVVFRSAVGGVSSV